MKRRKKYHEDSLVSAARQRVHKKKKFYKHLRTYLIVNMAMSILLFFEEGSLTEWMPIWIMWGMGLAFHYAKTFSFFGSPEWEKRELEKELQKRSIDQPDDWLDLNEIPQRQARETKPPYREEDLL